MISSSHPDLPALLAYLKRVEEARKLVAEFDEWLASAPPLPGIESPGEPDGGVSHAGWETTEDLAVRVVAILRHDGGPLRARDILTILRETGTSFITENPVYSVVGALKVARENGWVVKKGRGWWQAASQGRVDACEGVDDDESAGGIEGSSGGTRTPYA